MRRLRSSSFISPASACRKRLSPSRLTGTCIWKVIRPALRFPTRVTGSHCPLKTSTRNRSIISGSPWRKVRGMFARCIGGGPESFSEAESFHVEHQPSESWRVLDFPLNQHPEWRGKIEEVRLHLFNLYQNGFGRRLSFRAECRGTGYLRWLRAIKLG